MDDQSLAGFELRFSRRALGTAGAAAGFGNVAITATSSLGRLSTQELAREPETLEQIRIGLEDIGTTAEAHDLPAAANAAEAQKIQLGGIQRDAFPREIVPERQQ